MPKVSVCVITYNQEKYIRQCLQSIVDQETTFDFEIIVGEDCSTDGTRAIVQEFAEKFPLIIKTIFQEKNTGGSKNNVDVHAAATGAYIAQIDGDDFALPGKLQAQADTLDDNQDVSFSVHVVSIIDTKNCIGDDSRYPSKGSIHDLIRLGTYFANSSVMYRKNLEFPHHTGFEAIDYYMHIERASKGYIHLDRRVLGCYRMLSHSISKSARHRERVEHFYDAAFDRAIELGLQKEIVLRARIRKKMEFAVARYLSGDIDGYKIKIRLSKEEFKFATMKHIALHLTRFFPWTISFYFWLQQT